jgi:hypothetical protein
MYAGSTVLKMLMLQPEVSWLTTLVQETSVLKIEGAGASKDF